MKKAIIAFPMIEEVVQQARKSFDLIYRAEKVLDLTELFQFCEEHKPVALMISMRHKMTAEALAKIPSSVRVIATASVGYEHIDLKAAKEKNIYITNTPDVLTEATADQGFLLMLAAARRLPEAMGIMKAGWGRAQGFGENLGHDLRGKNLAILGMGRIGQSLAEKARAFGMNILYFNRKRLPPELEKGATYFSDLKSMLPLAQVLSLNAPATAETQKIMNKETFSLMPRGSIFVNVARGSLVDEEALIEALRSQHLFAAGLDVYAHEPQVDPRFLELPNVVLSPHIGSATVETRTAMGLRALENMQAALSGSQPRDNLI
ncbi:MAG: D-glycerate dehydrogenase [Bdellovibrio sp.]